MPDAPQPDTNKSIIFVVVAALAFNATLGLTSLAWCLVNKVEPNAVLLTAIMNITSGLLGVIGGMLTKTAPTETTKAPPVALIPSQVHVTNKPDDPVPTVTTP